MDTTAIVEVRYGEKKKTTLANNQQNTDKLKSANSVDVNNAQRTTTANNRQHFTDNHN